MNNKVLSAAALLVMSVTNVAHAGEHPSDNGQRGTVNFTGAITAQTCDTGIIVDGNDVAFVELPVITTSDFGTGASESTETPVAFGIAPLNPDDCPATTAALSLTGKTVASNGDILENTLDIGMATDKATGVGVQVLFDDKTSLLNKGYVDAGTNFDKVTKAVNLSANYFRTTEKANAGLVASVASYQMAYL
ncbi:hypothetical protein L4D77_07750 [Photobacterium frigidiphilum]|uniref:fimbrial protein n=1 Tax=Photobacterium frigidiphilum TaxID=264736 RepID=UPI003D0D01B7